jgi:hypothetical protein
VALKTAVMNVGIVRYVICGILKYSLEVKMTLDEAIQTRIINNKEQKEIDDREEEWLNSERF